ncbi:MAG: glycosyltransferase family 2 protein [Eubacteriales bacterium]|nr:glycosyltransferase family 2 protein [Eubacteriales bacterium]
MLLSIVIPCYNSSKTIGKVVETSMEEVKKIPDLDVEFVLVNDYSPDNTYEAICELAHKYPNVKGIHLARNFGQHNAIMAGLHAAEGDLIMGMDDDMQTHPSQIPILLGKLEEGYDIVFGVYKERKFGFWKNFTSNIAAFITWHLVERPKGLEASNYWLCRKYVRDEVIKYDSSNLYLQMLFFRTTRNIANVEIEHFEREEGSSNYTFRKLLKLFMSFVNFTVVPLRAATILGTISSGVGILGALIVLIRKLVNPGIQVGWSSLMCGMLLMFGFTFLMLGIIGEYLGKMILNQSKTPQFVIRDTINMNRKEETDD